MSWKGTGQLRQASGQLGTRSFPACKIKLPASWIPRRPEIAREFFAGIFVQKLGPQNSKHRFLARAQQLGPAQNREHQELGKADVPSSLFFGANSRGAKNFFEKFFLKYLTYIKI